MSSQDPPEKPEPSVDAPPDPGPGGPADAVEGHQTVPPAIPDQPRSAQVEDENVPDEIEQPEEVDEKERHEDPSDDDPE